MISSPKGVSVTPPPPCPPMLAVEAGLAERSVQSVQQQPRAAIAHAQRLCGLAQRSRPMDALQQIDFPRPQ